MVESGRPIGSHKSYMDGSHKSYMKDPAYLESRFGVRPLQELRLAPGVVGVARFIVMPAFSGESVNTFVYRAREVSIEVCSAEHSLWHSLYEGDWAPPVTRTYTKVLDDLPAPLNPWQSLKEAAQSAPTVDVAIVDGERWLTCDGVIYRHHIVDADVYLYAEWHNPRERASNHVVQVRLVKAYDQVFQSCGVPRVARQLVASHVESLSDNEYWGLVLLTDLVCLTVRKKEPGLVHVWLFETGTHVEVLLSDWSSWLSDPTLSERELQRLDMMTLEKVLPELRQRLPTSSSVLAAVDWDAKEQLAKSKKEEEARERQAWLDAVKGHNDACRAVFLAHGPEGLTCPHCGRQSTDIKFTDRAADERKSFFVCPRCGRSFGHDL
jgi:hypothetical protein